MPESKKLRVSVVTFGCKVNLFESEQLKKSLNNIEIVGEGEDADVFVINGCTVTAATDSQVRNAARKFSKKGRVIVTGCYARKNDPFLSNEPNIEFIQDISEVAALFGSGFGYSVEFDRARPFIKVQDGCDQFCAYCIIPLVRGGAIKSVPVDEVKRLLEEIHDKGYKEVVITGIHLGKYGKDLSGGAKISDIADLAFDSIGRVRLSSIEPIEIDAALLDCAKGGRILPHWHIPVQSGCDNVLKLMGRPYLTDEAAKFIEKVRAAYPDAPGIGTDIIAGFPGETDADFEETVRYVKLMPFTYGHVFPFSPRAGTKAFEMNKISGIPAAVIKERAAILREIFSEKKEAYQLSWVGKTLGMVLETQVSENIFDGTTDNYMQLKYYGAGLPREVKKVTIIKKGKGLSALPA